MILCVDGYNFLHRARAGFQLGEYHVAFNFFRNLRSLVEQFKPTRVIFAIEGVPVKRFKKFIDYKANRSTVVSDEEMEAIKITNPKEHEKLVKKLEDLRSFHRQKSLIIDTLTQCFPISVMRHPEHEADDVIYNLIKRSSSAIEWVVASNDSDFTQLLNEFSHVRVYNPMQKEFFVKPDYDYVDWKSFRGDGSDNIPGIPGVGDLTATRLVLYDEVRQKFFAKNPGAQEIWERNRELIKFFDFDDAELMQVTSSSPVRNWELLRKAFQEWGFNSLLKDKAWGNFIATFEPLWGTNAT
jgi:5'-3' exonuclease